MAILAIEAHNFDTTFETSIQDDYGVVIIDKAGAPWCVVFQGERDKLVAMVAEHWDAERAESIGNVISDDDHVYVQPDSIMAARIDAAVQEAQDCFWSKIAERFPEAKTGDFPPDAEMSLMRELSSAVTTWVGSNMPKNG